MRRVHFFTLVFVSLLFGGITSGTSPLRVSISTSPSTLGSWPPQTTVLLQNSCSVAPPVSSHPSVAYVTNISNLAHWQSQLTARVNETRLMRLLTSLTSFNNRHSCTLDGNASIEYITASLSILDVAYQSDWFSIIKETWNGFEYIYQTFWTRNLYVTPWSVNSTAPSVIITCHMDSARYSILGQSLTDAPGANDNAAGVAVLMEALQILTTTSGSFVNWNFLFAFLGGEEGNGTLSLCGSQQLISNGLRVLGINPATCLLLNIDEVAFKGVIWPTTLALYRYPGEDVNTMYTALIASALTLGIPLHDSNTPRAVTLEDVQNNQAWSITEWTFHTNAIPSLTISTNQYPDPYKHTSMDTVFQCNLLNIVNSTHLVIATVLALAYQCPPTPPNKSGEWFPIFSQVASLTLLDYVDPTLSQYPALILDPAIAVDSQITNHLTNLSRPVLALGRAGSQLVQHLTGSTGTSNGVQSLQVHGFKAFHPIIQSPYLLHNNEAALFQNATIVLAVSPTTEMLVLVGNASWCSLGYLPAITSHSSIIFMGVDSPEVPLINGIAVNSLEWLMDEHQFGICQGLDTKNPKVGTTPTLYTLFFDLASWIGQANFPVLLNITSAFTSSAQLHQVVTNGTGTASLVFLLTNSDTYTIQAKVRPSFSSTFCFTPIPICTSRLEYDSQVGQGEYLNINCFLNSSWASSAYINISLFADHVGSFTQTNLLLVPSENLYHLKIEILPNCPPRSYNLTLTVSTPNLTLLAEQLAITVQLAFLCTLSSYPQNALQNQLFPVLVSITNLGSQTRVFDIIAEVNFLASAQLIVQPNQTRTMTLLVQYLPQTFMDTGSRSLVIAFYVDNNHVTSAEVVIFIAYSAINLAITLLPPIFLLSLCIIGVCWMRKGKKSQQSQQPPLLTTLIPTGADSRDMGWGVTPETEGVQAIPFNPQVRRQLAQAAQKLGLTSAGVNRYTNDRVVLAWEKKGQEIHLVVQANNSQLVQRLLHLLTDDLQSPASEGDTRNDDLE